MKDLHELKLIRELTHFSDELIETHELDRVYIEGSSYPIIGFSIGTKDKSKPTLGLFGGVHGLERVGSHVVITYLTSLFKQLSWDEGLRRMLEECRIVSIPLINPGGMAAHSRANPNGVDLMRNAPIDCEEDNPTFLVSGHRISPKLPWYRGEEGKPMEVEAQALVDFCKDQLFDCPSAITIDFHSGFGMKDRLWFPYAKTSEPFPKIKQVQNLKDIMDETLPHHVYKIEPQFDSYTISGDLWDYIFDLHREKNINNSKVLIPWTLEMGSWIWVKKNPLQIFTAGGFFNPIKSHRYDRTMRRHLLLIDFMFRAARNFNSWT
ncbi:MAG: DUF2817 domain-containing protein [Halobacteriovoraceae bacterium]|nr:DUF2817 domain-containing protein [Halobacteriovoraceae bacterium]